MNDFTKHIVPNKKYIHVMRNKVINQTIEIIKKRLDESGTKSIEIQRYVDNRIFIQIPGINDATEIRDVLKKTAKLTFHIVNGDVMKEKPASYDTPFGIKYAEYIIERAQESSTRDRNDKNDSTEKYYIPINIVPAMFGDVFLDVQPINSMGSYLVQFKLNSIGTKIFGEITKNNIGKLLAIVLDGKIISCPVIKDFIGTGSGSISGSFSYKTAAELALLLRSGAMPAKLNIVEEKIIGPTLGYQSTILGIKAIISAGIAVSIAMICIYKFFGILASFSLFINFLMLVSLFGIIGITMTLPGLAGITLTLGMAIDANVLIFERMREEKKKKQTIQNIIFNAHKRALGAIFDSNITSIMISLILYVFGSAAIKGFSLTIFIGIICSFFTSVILTRYLVELWHIRTKSDSLPI